MAQISTFKYMVIKQNDDGKTGVFFVGEYGDRLAELDYSWRDKNVIVVNHTEVNEELEGHGVGKQLVERMVEFARENDVTVVPLCTFAKRVIDMTPEFQDVLKK